MHTACLLLVALAQHLRDRLQVLCHRIGGVSAQRTRASLSTPAGKRTPWLLLPLLTWYSAESKNVRFCTPGKHTRTRQLSALPDPHTRRHAQRTSCTWRLAMAPRPKFDGSCSTHTPRQHSLAPARRTACHHAPCHPCCRHTGSRVLPASACPSCLTSVRVSRMVEKSRIITHRSSRSHPHVLHRIPGVDQTSFLIPDCGHAAVPTFGSMYPGIFGKPRQRYSHLIRLGSHAPL